MAKVRVYELAKELGVDSKTVLAEAKDLGEFVRSASSTLEAPVVRRLREKLTTGAEPAKKPASAGAARSGAPSVTIARPGPAPTAPTTGAPAGRPTVAPTTQVPTGQAPTSQAPTSESPTSQAPAAAAPAARPGTTAGDGTDGLPPARPGAGSVPRTPGQAVPGPRTPSSGTQSSGTPSSGTQSSGTRVSGTRVRAPGEPTRAPRARARRSRATARRHRPLGPTAMPPALAMDATARATARDRPRRPARPVPTHVRRRAVRHRAASRRARPRPASVSRPRGPTGPVARPRPVASAPDPARRAELPARCRGLGATRAEHLVRATTRSPRRREWGRAAPRVPVRTPAVQAVRVRRVPVAREAPARPVRRARACPACPGPTRR